MTAMESAGRKMKQMGRQIESSVGNFRHMMSSVSLVGDAKHFQEGRMNKFAELRKHLESKKEKEKLEAMKTLIAMMTLGRDVSELFPHVVKNVVAESMEVKKLVYMYVINYAASNSDLALLAISSFQKDMSSPNPLVRAKALHAMACMRVASVAHLIIIALKHCVKDSSAYVRRTAAHVLPAVFELDPKFKPDLIAMLTILLKDNNVYVLGGTLYAFNILCPMNFDLIHGSYRKICHLLADMDEWGQAMAIEILLRYARNQFRSPFLEIVDEEKNVSSDSKETTDDEDIFFRKENLIYDIPELDVDHRLLLSSIKNLIHSQNSHVVLGTVRLLYYCAPVEECNDAISALVHFIVSRREISYIILANISTMSSERPELFQGFYKEFYIKGVEPGFIKELKLDILSKIAAESNIQPILREFLSYATDSDVKFRCATIEAMGRCASMIPDVAEKTMSSLMTLLSDQCPDVVASAVVVIRKIIQRNPSKYEKAMRRLLRFLRNTNVPAARCAIVWIAGEYREYIADYAPDALRILAKNFIKEADEVKMQILNLAVKVYLAEPQKVIKLFKYILDLCKYDQNYDLRDRARMIRVIFFLKKKKSQNNSNNDSSNGRRSSNYTCNPDVQRKLRKCMQEMFLAPKSIPEISSPFKDRDRFVMGSLSHMVIHCASDNYLPLEDFPEVPPDTSELREVGGLGSSQMNNSSMGNKLHGKSSDFWNDDGSIDEYTSSTDDSSDDSSSSTSGSSSDGSSSESESSSVSFSSSDVSESELSVDSLQVSIKKSDNKKMKVQKSEETDDSFEIEISSSDEMDADILIESKIKEKSKTSSTNDESSDEIIEFSDSDDDESISKNTKSVKKEIEYLDLLSFTTDTTTTVNVDNKSSDTTLDMFSDMFNATNVDKKVSDEQSSDEKPKKKKLSKKEMKKIKKAEKLAKKKKAKKKSKSKKKKKRKDSSESEPEDDETTPDSSSMDEFEDSDEQKAEQKEEEKKEEQSSSTLDPISIESSNAPTTNQPLADVFSDLGNTNNTTLNSDDILFGANAQLLMNKPQENIGCIGELLNHTHTQGLQIDYEFMRNVSPNGKRYNMIRLRCTNKWNVNMKGITFSPVSLDKEKQNFVNIEHGIIQVLKPNEERVEYIHVQFGAQSEMRFDIHVQSGTNRCRYISKIKAMPGEMLYPSLNMNIDSFLKKQIKMTGMVERNIVSNITDIELATKCILVSFNVAPLNIVVKVEIDLRYERYFAGKLLKDDADVLIRLSMDQKNGVIVCSVNCSEFMLIDQLNDVAKKCLNPKE